uniref:Uncharacterized protein n=1 Tax=Romanomermis culicivorax TaxID=13658 RepID=A0A915IFW9_ROMCU
MDESTPIQSAAMDSETTPTTDQMLTDIPQESTLDQSTSMDIVPAEPATMMPATVPTVDLGIYLATPAVLTGPPIIATFAAARYSAPVRFSQHIISDSQWQAMAKALAVYHFPPPPPSMLFPEHHWRDYPDALKEEIQRILLPPPTLIAPFLKSLKQLWLSPKRLCNHRYRPKGCATTGYITAADRCTTTTGAATALACNSSAADGACRRSNPTGPQHIRASSRSLWPAY